MIWSLYERQWNKNIVCMNCRNLYGQHKRTSLWHKISFSSDELAPIFHRCQFCFESDTLVVAEVDVFTYEEASLLIGARFRAVDALCFQNREKVFGQSIVIRISASWHWRRYAVWLSQAEICLWCLLKALVTVELQLCSDLFFPPGFSDRTQYKVYILFCAGFVGDDTVVVQVPNDWKRQKSLACFDVWYICYPLLIRTICMEVSVQQIGITMQMIAVMLILLSPDNRKQIVFPHYTQHRLRTPMDPLPVKPDQHSPITIGLLDLCLTGADLFSFLLSVLLDLLTLITTIRQTGNSCQLFQRQAESCHHSFDVR